MPPPRGGEDSPDLELLPWPGSVPLLKIGRGVLEMTGSLGLLLFLLLILLLFSRALKPEIIKTRCF